MEATIFKIGYKVIDSRLYVRLLGRDTNGSKIDKLVSRTRPYFYVDAQEAAKIPSVQQIISHEPGPEALDHRQTIRCYTRFPYDVPVARDRFNWSGEADIVYTTRMRVDHGLTHIGLPDTNTVVPISAIKNLSVPPKVTPRILRLDIEVDDSRGFPRPENAADHPITAISFHDSYKNTYGLLHSLDHDISPVAFHQHFPQPITDPIRVFQKPSEYDILGAFGRLLDVVQPDVTTAWNGYGFDFPYLGERAKYMMGRDPGNPDLQRIVDTFGELDQNPHREPTWRSGSLAANMDSMMVYQKREMRQRSWALDSVATDMFGFGKVPRPLSVSELQRTDPEKWGAYTIWDAHLLRMIDERQSLVDYIFKLARLAGIDPEDCEHESRIVDGVLMITARKNGAPRMCLPTKKRGMAKKDAKGALTLPPVVGMFLGIIALDLKQEYPSLMLTYNISPDTRVLEPAGNVRQLPTGGMYRKDVLGIVPEALIGMREFREAIKKRIEAAAAGTQERADAQTDSRAVKYAVNAFAGVIKSEHWRGYSPATFGDITGMARLQLAWDRDHVQDPKWLAKVVGPGITGEVVMGDTDSVMVRLFRDGAPISDIDELRAISDRLRDALNESFIGWAAQYGATENFTSVGVQGVYERLRTLPKVGSSKVGAKKRYFGIYAIEDGKDVRSLPTEKRMDIKGVEYKRFNNAPVTGTVTFEIMKLLCEGLPAERMLSALTEFQQKALAGEIDDDLLVRAKMGKDSFEEYDSMQPFARAIENWGKLSGRPVRKEDEFHWGWLANRSTGFDLLAIPLGMSLADARKMGYDIQLDRPRMVEQTITSQVRKVFPEIDGMPAVASEDEF